MFRNLSKDKRQYLQSTLTNVFLWQKKEFWVKAYDYEYNNDAFDTCI